MKRTHIWRALVTAICFTAVPLGVAVAHGESSEDAGTAIVVDAVNSTRALTEGDSRTAFSLRLPAGATCPGDSANDDWRVQSFLVPADTDVGALRYRALRPDGDAYRALRYPNGDIFTQAFTDPNPGPGSPGRILPIPVLTMAWFPAGSLPPGLYKVGIACTPSSWEVAKFWDSEIRLEEAPDVEPGGLRWSVVESADDAISYQSSGTSSGQSGDSSVALVLVVVVIAGSLAAVMLIRRRRTGPTSSLAKDAT